MPSGENSWNQLFKKGRRRSKGDLAQAQATAWLAVRTAEGGMAQAALAGDHDVAIRWCHCLSQTLSTWLKVATEGDLEGRLAALEERLREQP